MAVKWGLLYKGWGYVIWGYADATANPIQFLSRSSKCIECSMGSLTIREDIHFINLAFSVFLGNQARMCLHDGRDPHSVSEALTHDPGQLNLPFIYKSNW